VRDLDLVEALWTHYGHRLCGLYASVTIEGRLAEGDAVEAVS
jgi:MOSC domain-containing protein YiiM